MLPLSLHDFQHLSIGIIFMLPNCYLETVNSILGVGLSASTFLYFYNSQISYSTPHRVMHANPRTKQSRTPLSIIQTEIFFVNNFGHALVVFASSIKCGLFFSLLNGVRVGYVV